MISAYSALRRAYNSACIQAAALASIHSSALLFLLGVGLLAVGIDGLSHAQLKKAEQTPTKPSQEANHKFEPFLSSQKVAQSAGAFGPSGIAVARPADRSFFGPSPFDIAIGRPAERNQAGLRAEPIGNSRLAEVADPLPPQNTDIPYDDTLIRNSVGNLYKFIEGAFGALLVVGAGIGAIIAATLGAYKAALVLLVVSVGAFILRAYVSLFFGTDYQDYEVIGDF